MNRLLLLFLTFFCTASFASTQKIVLISGEYHAFLQLNQTTQLPIHLTVEKRNNASTLIIHNATEKIELINKSKKGDTTILAFPNFDSELRIVVYKKKELRGFWWNYNKGTSYKIPFFASLNTKQRKKQDPTVNLTGKWETYFSPDTKESEQALGLFEQKGNYLTGTFRTETGDYRYMEGYVENNNFYLAAFDGSHAFLLHGIVQNNVATGTFYSGKHYQTTFKASLNPNFELRDADSLTQLKSDSATFQFDLKDLNGNNYHYPNIDLKGKVVIIQIMGTWCPNCMDETNYYKELYDKYHDKGLEIISIAYETSSKFEDQVKQVLTLQQRKDLHFIFLIGGKASKEIASQQFHMLNEIMSFPTSIFIGRNGEIKRIHTGFNGPATGESYTQYVQKTNALIEALLNQ